MPEKQLAFGEDARSGLMRGEQTFRYGPRVIDVDILLYGNQTIHLDEPDLQIPHARIAERAFVLVPLSEIAEGVVHPELNLPIGQLSQMVEGLEGVNQYGPPLDLT